MAARPRRRRKWPRPHSDAGPGLRSGHVAFHPSPGSYTDPLRSINGLTPNGSTREWITPDGPDHRHRRRRGGSTVNGGWPGGTSSATA